MKVSWKTFKSNKYRPFLNFAQMMRKRARVATTTVTTTRRPARGSAITRVRQTRAGRIPRAIVGLVRTGGFYGRFGPTGELKFFDTYSGAAVAVGAAGTITNNCLNIIPQSDGQSGRVGRSVTVKAVYMKGFVNLASQATAVAATDTMRVIIYLDKQANGAAATAGNILAVLPGGAVDFLSFRNLENSARFQILAEKKFDITAMAGPAGVSTGAREISFNLAKKCNIPITWDSTAATGALTTVRSNNIGVLCINQVTSATIEYNCRLRYSDM